MNTAIKHASFLKYGVLGITLAIAAYITQTTSFSSATAELSANDTAVQVDRLDSPTFSKLWADYDAVFLEQEKSINQAVSEVETAAVEIDKLVAAIDNDISDFLAIDSSSDAGTAPIRLGFAATY